MKKLFVIHGNSCKSCLAVLFLITMIVSSFTANGQAIFSNQITDPNPSSFTPFTIGQYSDPHLTCEGISRGTGLTPVIGADRYNAANFSSTVRDTSDYFSFVMIPDSVYQINFSSFEYTGQKNTEGPVYFSLKCSINGYSTTIGFPTAAGTSISLSAITFQNIRVPVEFRLYAWGAANSTGTFSINDFAFNGEVVLAPQMTATSIASFGNVCVNNLSAVNSFTVQGYNLTSDSVKLSALTAYQYSLDNVSYLDSLSFLLPGTQSKLVYVRFRPTAAISYFGNILISGGGASGILAPVAGRGIGTIPTVTTGSVSNITTSSALISVSVTNSGCSAISAYGIEYSITAGFANGTGTQVPGSNLSGIFFSVPLTGLTPPGQTYYFHTYAINDGGVKYGTENSFTLLSDVPALIVPVTGSGSLASFGNVCINTTSNANSFRLTGSMLNGSNIVVGPLANYSFSLTSGGTYVSALTLTQGGSGYSYVSGTLTSCTIFVKFSPGTTGNYNGMIPVSGGGAPSVDVVVAANGVNAVPVTVTGSALSITTSSANLQATITNAGCSSVSSYGFEYSTNPGFTPGTGIRVTATGISGNAFSFSLNGLSPSTVYYYCSYATNSGGTGYGLVSNFLTAAVPTQLVITSISPSTPVSLAPFSITVNAVDNLTAMNPINVTENTTVLINLTTGNYVLTIPNQITAVIPVGTNSITINGNFYSHEETNVGIQATTAAGMSLTTSPEFHFDVLPYTGSGDFIWASDGGNRWLIGDNWQSGRPPGASMQSSSHTAHFTSLAGLDNTSTGGCGIDMEAVGQDFTVGSIIFESSYDFNHANGAVSIGNSSAAVDGVLNIEGSTAANLGGIAGNNFSDLLLANYMTGSTTRSLVISNSVATGNQSMELHFPNPGTISAPAGNEIDFNVRVSGSSSLTFTGGGIYRLTPSGISTVNAFNGVMKIADGTVVAGNNGAFNSVSPCDVVLGSLPSNRGEINCNGKNVTLGSLSTNGNAGTLNRIHNGTANSILTISSNSNTVFAGVIADGSSGQLSLVKTGTGSIELTENCSYTGNTTVNNGVLRLNKTGGNTLPSNNSLVLNGGELQVSSSQTLKDITLNGGTLRIDNGVVLTITGSYLTSILSTTTIINNGTIKISCGSIQSFPGQTVVVGYMNNLIADNPAGVQLNNDLAVSGVLNIVSGFFSIGNHLLTVFNPIAGNGILTGGATSSIRISGTAAGIVIPPNINLLKNLTVDNQSGTVLQADLSINGQLQIDAGLVMAPDNIILNGSGSVVMTGGELRLFRNGVALPELTGVYTLTGGAIGFAGSGIQTVRPLNYFDLISYSGGGRILSPTGTIGIGNSFIPSDNNYTINGSIVDFKKSGNQEIPAFEFYHLKISGGGGGVKNLSGKINIKNRFTLLADTKLSLGDYDVELLSDSMMTAAVGYVSTANSFIYNGTGRFVVDRFIPVALTHAKSWQFLSVPDFGGNLKDCWQESNSPLSNNNAGFGTTISGARQGAVSRGFDFYTPAGSSVKYYDDNTGYWTGIDDGVSTTEVIQMANTKGYMIFVRGDRSVQSYNAPATITTLRTRGKLYSRGADAPSSIAVMPGHLQSVGNPYASAIDFTSLLSTSSSLDTKFYVWDPLLPGSYGYGAFQTISSANGYRPVPGGTSNYDATVSYTGIQSGQAFFVYSSTGGTVGFSESNKISGSATPFRFNNAVSSIRADLYNAFNTLADGNAVLLSDDFENSFGSEDAIKISNFSESFSVSNNGHNLAIDSRNNITVNDTVFYHLSGLKPQQYHLHFTTENTDYLPVQMYLRDNYSMSEIAIDNTHPDYYFTVNNESGSYAPGRFHVYFKPLAVLPVSTFVLSETHDKNNVNLRFDVSNENGVARYELQSSSDGYQFETIHQFEGIANNGSFKSYLRQEHKMAPLIFYRVYITKVDGTKLSSNIVDIRGDNISNMFIYPNPVTDNNLQLHANHLSAGIHQAGIWDSNGRLIQTFILKMTSGVNTKVLKINNNLPKGCYQLIVNGKNLSFMVE